MNPVMNLAASTYDLPLFTAAPPSYETTPQDSFVTGLVSSLAWTFNLDTDQQALAEQLLFGRPLGALARHLELEAMTAQRMCQELFVTTGTDGRQKLFELSLRLTTMRELGTLLTKTDNASARPADDDSQSGCSLTVGR